MTPLSQYFVQKIFLMFEPMMPQVGWPEEVSGVRVIKPMTAIPLFFLFLASVKTLVAYWKSCSLSYLTGPLRLSYNSIHEIYKWFREPNRYFCKIKNSLSEKLMNGALVTLIPGPHFKLYNSETSTLENTCMINQMGNFLLEKKIFLLAQE